MTQGGGIYSEGIIFKFQEADLGINALTTNSRPFNIYPNPNEGSFTISLSNRNDRCNIEIYNVLGETAYKATLNSYNTEIDLSGQPNGIYLYRVVNTDGTLVGEGKVVVAK